MYLLMLFGLLIRGLKVLYIEKQPFQRMMLLIVVVILINHCIFEMTGDFFWAPKYSALFAAFMGLLCGVSGQSFKEQYYSEWDCCEYPEEDATIV